MGHGSYSSESRTLRSVSKGYSTKSTREIFKQENINSAMNPFGVKVRESRDSEEHPNSLGIVIGLDVTGSMGMVPHQLIKDGLPTIMESIMDAGEPDPQVLFMGIGDHEYDNAPLQVSQFESSDELLDKWLETTYLEGGGGANNGESYLLAHYFAAHHTSMDCWEKRQRKGFLFTIGDEPVLPLIKAKTLKGLMGPGQYADFTTEELLVKAAETFNVFHIHISETYSGNRPHVLEGWQQLLKENVLVAQNHKDVADLIAKTIIEFGQDPTVGITTKPTSDKPENDDVQLF